MPSGSFRFLRVAGWDLISDHWIRRLSRMTDSDLRAHSIALSYSKYGTCLDELIYGEDSVRRCIDNRCTPKAHNANWFHFALWGTLTVTQNIGSDRPPQRLNAGPAMWLRRSLTPALAQARAADGQLLGRALAWGQWLIFVSSALALKRFASLSKADVRDLCEHPEHRLLTGADQRRIEELCTWNHTAAIKRARHLANVEQAFRWLAWARHVEEPNARARFMLGATVQLTAIEQDLVDPALDIVVNFLPRRLIGSLERRAGRVASRLSDVPEDLSALGLAYRYLSEREFAYAVWSRLMTDQVLVMALPTETLRLGRDIPPRRPGTAFAPKVLRGNLEPDPADHSKLADALRDVARLVGSLDRSVGDGRGSAAHDWRRWDDRMNWAVNLFRSRQQDLTLFWPPYSEADQERIVKGELPHRAGDPSAHDVQAPVDGTAFGVSREEPCP